MEKELQHHGILGMKWGIRRYQPYPDGSTTNTKKMAGAGSSSTKSVDASTKSARKSIVANRRSLSDDDLKKVLSRVQAEKQLKTMIEEDISPGKTAVKQIMSSVAKKTLTTALSGVAIYALSTAVSGGEITRKGLGESMLSGGKTKSSSSSSNEKKKDK